LDFRAQALEIAVDHGDCQLPAAVSKGDCAAARAGLPIDPGLSNGSAQWT
jgi:hypothetical protein